MWKCSHCGEEVEPSFDACWKCGTGKDGSSTESAVPYEEGVRDELMASTVEATELHPPEPTQMSLFAKGAAVVLIVSFFLPWTRVFGLNASGYEISRFGASGSLTWWVPVTAGTALVVGWTIRDFLVLRIVAGVTPWLGLLYGLGNWGEQLVSTMGIGAYVALVGGVMLIFASPDHALTTAERTPAGLPLQTAALNVDQDRIGAEADDIVGQIERLASLRERGMLSETDFAAAKAKLLS